MCVLRLIHPHEGASYHKVPLVLHLFGGGVVVVVPAVPVSTKPVEVLHAKV